MDLRRLSPAAWSAFKSWLIKLRGIPVAHRRLLDGGWPAEELPALVRELKRVRTDFKKRPNAVSAPADEGIREAYSALGVPWSAWSEVRREVQRDLKRKRYARWAGADALDFPEGPPFEQLVTVLPFGGAEQARPHLLRRASLAAGSLEALWCRWLAGEPLAPETLRSFAGPPERLAEPLYTPGLAEVLPLFFVEPDIARAERALAVASEQEASSRLRPLMDLLRSLLGLWRGDTALEEVRARFKACVTAIPPPHAVELVAPAYLQGQHLEPLPPHALMEDLGSRLERRPVPARVADVQPVMDVLTALEELAAQGQGLRVEQGTEEVILSARKLDAEDSDRGESRMRRWKRCSNTSLASPIQNSFNREHPWLASTHSESQTST